MHFAHWLNHTADRAILSFISYRYMSGMRYDTAITRSVTPCHEQAVYKGQLNVIRDHRPYWLKRLVRQFEHWYSGHFVTPHFASLGDGHLMMKPWNIRVSGKAISAGKHIHVVTAKDRLVSLSTWTFESHQGVIDIGNHVLLCPGVRLDSASRITIGDNCMFAAGAYVTDADWHDIYDRTRAVGTTRPVTLEDNVWIGDGAIVCKGVTIGRNSVVGAGAVVSSDVPANVIVAGNPARVVKELDPERELVTREQLFKDPAALEKKTDDIERYVLYHNTVWGWLRSYFRPKRGD